MRLYDLSKLTCILIKEGQDLLDACASGSRKPRA
jgi:hypothetical protein